MLTTTITTAVICLTIITIVSLALVSRLRTKEEWDGAGDKYVVTEPDLVKEEKHWAKVWSVNLKRAREYELDGCMGLASMKRCDAENARRKANAIARKIAERNQ